MTNSLASNETLFTNLQSDGQKKLLDTIDRLSSLGINEYIHLPQLVVCGAQSCGKSSVLEAISGVKFPAKDGCCTTFATELVLRRSQRRKQSVSIRPDRARSEQEKKMLAEFKPKKFDNIDDVPAMIKDAQDHMAKCIPNGESSFSKDVLCVEIKGPEAPHLTIVDLPGLIMSATRKQKPGDIAIVKGIVDEYVKNPRSIILAVIQANYDASNQGVLEMLQQEHIDPKRCRTIGIITQPDRVEPDSTMEEYMIDMANNKDVVFDLGWYVLRNRGEKNRDSSTEERDKAEAAFFSTGAWADKGPKDRLGIDKLWPALTEVFVKQICVDLPDVMKEIECGIKECDAHLKQLGKERSSVEDQRSFLTEIGTDFRDLAAGGADGIYQHDFFEHSTNSGGNRRIRAAVITLNTQFAEDIRTNGRKWPVYPIQGDASDPNANRSYTYANDDLTTSIKDFISDRNRGGLPGTRDPLLIGKLFQKQAAPWKEIATDHISEVWDTVLEILEEIAYEVTDKRVAHILLANHIHPEMDKIKQALTDKLDEVLRPHLQNTAMTYDQNFISVVEHVKRQHGRTQPGSSTDGGMFSFYSGANTQLDLTDQEMIDIMEGYYDIAVKIFVDNVAALVIDNCLMNLLPDLFSPNAVARWEPELLQSVGGETEETVSERNKENEKLRILKEGQSICQGFVNRAPKTTLRGDDRYRKARVERKQRGSPGGQNLAPQHTRASGDYSAMNQYAGAPTISVLDASNHNSRPQSRGSQAASRMSRSSSISAEPAPTSVTTPPQEGSPARLGALGRQYRTAHPAGVRSGQGNSRQMIAALGTSPWGSNGVNDEEL